MCNLLAFCPLGLYYTPPAVLQLLEDKRIPLANPPFGALLPGSYQIDTLPSFIGQERSCMTAQTATDIAATDTAPGKTVPMTQAIIILTGAELRRIVAAEPAAPFARASRRFGELDVELVRHGSTWHLYLADLAQIPHTTRDLWATAVGAPSVEWDQTLDGCSAWCEWTENARRAI